MNYTILYRGELASCNYSCFYCPFAEKTDTNHELEKDIKSLEKFCQWLEKQNHLFSVFFTPKGEALTRTWYREKFIDLSHKNNITKVAIQTNLSCNTDWIKKCNTQSSGFWLTFHPEQISAENFLKKCMVIYDLGISFSVGVVGVKENFSAISEMKNLLPEDVYLWINGFKRTPDYYNKKEINFLKKTDPLFLLNMHYYKSYGKKCYTGENVFSIEGDGNIKRCHFTDELYTFFSYASITTVPLNTFTTKFEIYLGFSV